MSEHDLRDCYFCGAEVEIRQAQTYKWVQCKKCGARGPETTSKEGAADLWNEPLGPDE